jgi:DNA-binding response OmpR family regulator
MSDSDTFLDHRILVIDDTELNLQLILNILGKRGFSSVFSARDGVEALEKIVVAKPDLIILDVMMPRMDGFVFCKYIRANDEYKNTPILVLTSSPEDYIKMAMLGATDMIQKPIIPRMLIGKVFEHLQMCPMPASNIEVAYVSS